MAGWKAECVLCGTAAISISCEGAQKTCFREEICRVEQTQLQLEWGAGKTGG
jgi:hypothetical protein